MSRPALNLTALIEQTKGYRAALQAFNARKRRLRLALLAWKDGGLVKIVDSSAGGGVRG